MVDKSSKQLVIRDWVFSQYKRRAHKLREIGVENLFVTLSSIDTVHAWTLWTFQVFFTLQEFSCWEWLFFSWKLWIAVLALDLVEDEALWKLQEFRKEEIDRFCWVEEGFIQRVRQRVLIIRWHFCCNSAHVQLQFIHP